MTQADLSEQAWRRRFILILLWVIVVVVFLLASGGLAPLVILCAFAIPVGWHAVPEGITQLKKRRAFNRKLAILKKEMSQR